MFQRIFPFLILILTGVAAKPLQAADAPALGDKPTVEQLTFFEKKVRPLLVQRCLKCHGEKKQQGGLRLDSRAALMTGGDSGSAFDQKMPAKSLFLEAISYSPDAVVEMPPDGKLKTAEIAILTSWVKMGAPWPATSGKPQPNSKPDGPLFSAEEKNLWAFKTPIRPEIPKVKQADWPRADFDHFVLGQLEEQGLAPAPATDKRTWIRRATFDLLGLPPSPQQIADFLADKSPEAFARVVDRLLASPRYGENWGRHWLDVARYADSNGMDENLAYANAFRYRDYVIDSFNDDKPFDQFVREQIAGDLLPVDDDVNRTIERQVATGFLCIGPKMLAEDDPLKMRVDIIDEQIETIGRAFMGMTLGCARCHAHKFDPIPQEDYYGLAGIFLSTKTMENYKVVARWYERPLAAPAVIAKKQSQQKQIAQHKTKIAAQITAANQTLLSDARSRAGDYLRAATEWNRHRAALGLLTSLMAVAGKKQPTDSIVVEAEKFTRGNLKKDFATYGTGIGVVINGGKLPNFAEFDVNIPKPGVYQLEIRLAAAESRPVKISLNGTALKNNATATVTGSWTPETQKWVAETALKFTPGKNTLRLERGGPFPHIDKIAIVPVDLDLPGEAPKTLEQVAAEHGLQTPFVVQWADYLKRTGHEPTSPFAPWHALQSTSSGKQAELFAEFYAESQTRLAKRYQQLFDAADAAWKELKSSDAGKEAKKLADPTQESLRHVLYDPKGPFATPGDAEKLYPEKTAAPLKSLQAEVKKLQDSIPQLPQGMGVTEDKIQNSHVNIRGNHINLGAEVPRQFLSIIAGEQQTPIDDTQSGRLQFADWLSGSSHPLTSRVIVNRIWRWHFGAGIVSTPDNFGTTGELPINQPLLDWLAVDFAEKGWSIKALHRRIMLSATYRMSTKYDSAAAEKDPENKYLWRMNRRRLSAEEIRDSVLAVAETINFDMGGSLLTTKNRGYVASTASVDSTNYDTTRRSVYLPVVRSALFEMFTAFDFPDPSSSNGNRATTTIAPQALFMLNSDFMEKQTAAMARIPALSVDDGTVRLREAYSRTLGREPTAAEVERARQFLTRYQQAISTDGQTPENRRLQAWQALCRVLLASSDFVYVD